MEAPRQYGRSRKAVQWAETLPERFSHCQAPLSTPRGSNGRLQYCQLKYLIIPYGTQGGVVYPHGECNKHLRNKSLAIVSVPQSSGTPHSAGCIRAANRGPGHPKPRPQHHRRQTTLLLSRQTIEKLRKQIAMEIGAFQRKASLSDQNTTVWV